MNDFTLDDIDILVVSGVGRLDSTSEYDISYYENYINENISIIGGLIKNILNQIKLIKDEATKNRVLNWSKYLVKAYEKNKNKQPKIEYENSSYSLSSGTGYFQTHKYSMFIEKDFASLVRSYSNIINFMNNVYKNATILEEKYEIDSNILYGIFNATKRACRLLGIHSPDAFSLYNSITKGPYDENNELFDMDVEIDENNSLRHDIIITCLPYTVTAPMFTWEGPSKYEIPVTSPNSKVWYNKSYLQKPPIR